MNHKTLRRHLFFGCLIVIILGIVLFPDKNLAQKSEVPHLGQISPRTIVAPISFEVPKSAQEIINEKSRAADKVYAVFEYNHDETEIGRAHVRTLLTVLPTTRMASSA